MKNLSTVLSALALIGVLVLFGMHFSGNKSVSSGAGSSVVATGSSKGRIAFVNIDTLEAHYTYLKAKKDEFEKRQQSVQAELVRSQQQMEKDYADVQRKYQAGTLTQAEGEAAQKRLGQMNQSLETRKTAVAEQLMAEQAAFNKDLKDRLDKFLEGYNKEKQFDYILSYQPGGSILFANPQLDITEDVIKGMNALPDPAVDTAKKK